MEHEQAEADRCPFCGRLRVDGYCPAHGFDEPVDKMVLISCKETIGPAADLLAEAGA